MTVEINASLISKGKYPRCRKQSGQQWVVGGVREDTTRTVRSFSREQKQQKAKRQPPPLQWDNRPSGRSISTLSVFHETVENPAETTFCRTVLGFLSC